MRHEFLMPSTWLTQPVTVALVGAGGTGSDMLVRLAKLHRQLVALGSPGFEVTVYDPDVVSETNVGRQHFSPVAVGLNKAIALVHSINLAYCLDWEAIPRAFSVDTPTSGRRVDLLITCVDKALFRAQLARAHRNTRTWTLWADTGNGTDSGNVVLGHLGKPNSDVRRLPNVFDLWPELADMTSADEQAPSCSAEESIQRQSWPVNQAASLLLAELLWTLMRNGKIDYHGYTFNLRPMTTSPIWIDPDHWSFFGYSESAPKTKAKTTKSGTSKRSAAKKRKG